MTRRREVSRGRRPDKIVGETPWGWRWSDDEPGTCREFSPQHIHANEQVVGPAFYTYSQCLARRILARWREHRYRASKNA